MAYECVCKWLWVFNDMWIHIALWLWDRLYAPPSHLAISHPCRSLRPLGKIWLPSWNSDGFCPDLSLPPSKKDIWSRKALINTDKEYSKVWLPTACQMLYVFCLYPASFLQMFGRCESPLLFVWWQCMHGGHTNFHLLSYVELSDSVGKWTLTQLCVFRVLISFWKALISGCVRCHL